MQFISIISLALSAINLINAEPIARSSDVWQVEHFRIKSVHAGKCPDEFNMVQYQLHVKGNNSAAQCNAVTDSTAATECDDYQVPIGFHNHACTGCTKTPWSWTLNATKSVTQPPQPGFVLQLAYDAPGAVPLFACRFISLETKCSESGKLEIEVPSNFTLTPQTSSQCIFA